MMNLLDFPPEIFQKIVRELVSASGVDDAWKLRQVCRTFAGEIEYDIFNIQALKFHDIYSKSGVSRLDLKVLLANRLKRPVNADSVFLAKIHQMLDFLMEELAIGTPAQLQNLTEELCKTLSVSISTAQLSAILSGHFEISRGYRRDTDRRAKSLSLSQKLITAVSVNSHDLVRKLLPLSLEETIESSAVFGDPLTVAIDQGNIEMVHTILGGLQRMGIKHCSLQEARSASFHGSNVASAISRAIRRENADVLQTLVNFFNENFTGSRKRQYNDWLIESIPIQDVRILRCLLGLRIQGRTRVERKVLESAAIHGSPQHMEVLITSGGLDVNKKYKNTSPLIAAVRGGNIDVVRAVLDAGADVNMTIRGELSAMSVAISIELWIYSRLAIGKVLLSRGATLPEASTWPSAQGVDSLVRAMLEDVKKKREGFQRSPANSVSKSRS
ncbi:Nn.00g026790.m01.CDS01 [Neocucurbitaria sp. VM-36]